MNKNIRRELSAVTCVDREKLNGHKPLLIWLTGLSGSGKSTLSYHLERILFERGLCAYVLDGDNMRHGLCSDLDFGAQARTENIRRVGEVAKILLDAGLVTISSFISPVREDREKIRDSLGEDAFVEIFCSCPIETCEARDVKGLYQKAREGLIPEFTGISSPYEAPLNPALTLDTSVLSLDECLTRILDVLEQRGLPV